MLQSNAAARRQLVALLGRKAADGTPSGYVVLDRELSEQQSAGIKALPSKDQDVLALTPHPIRVYPLPGGAPATTLASQLLGFVTATPDGTSYHGNYGIEQRYDAELAGRPTLMSASRDPFGRPLQSSALVTDQGVDGKDVRLTIDATLQLQLEKELYAAWVADKAKVVSGLVLDPRNGQILAWASVPGYDANDFAHVASTQPLLLQDPIVSQVYEPGSVMKMLTATAALQTHTVTPNTLVDDTGALRIGTQVVHDSDWLSMGWIPFKDVIAYSRNVGTAKVAARLGATTAKASEVLFHTWQTYGIGQRSGVDLASEEAGIAADPSVQPWQRIDLANRSFGQGVAVTPAQLATAYTSMINGGLRVQPHFLAAVGDVAQPDPEPRRIIPAALAGTLQGIMHHVLSSVPWYAQQSLIPGWQVGGKTGTAQIWMPQQAQYSPNTFNFSFVGYVGGDKPAAVVVLRIGEARPKIKGHGKLVLNITSYGLFERVARDAIDTLDIPRASDPAAGLPEPLSQAERVLQPQLFAKHKYDIAHGIPVDRGPLGGRSPRRSGTGG